MVGDKLTYVDLAVLNALRITIFQYPERWAKTTTIPLLKAFVERMESRPNLAAYYKSDRCAPFQGYSFM